MNAPEHQSQGKKSVDKARIVYLTGLIATRRQRGPVGLRARRNALLAARNQQLQVANTWGNKNG